MVSDRRHVDGRANHRFGMLREVDSAYFEGGDYALWDTDTGTMARIENSFSYAGGYSDVAWLPYSNQLIHARSGSDSGGVAKLSLIDPLDLTLEKVLIEFPWEGPESVFSSVLGFAERPDGTIVFGLRSGLLVDGSSNGFFRVQPDGAGLVKIVELPDARSGFTADGGVGGLWCRMVFAPDASIYLCHNEGSTWPRHVLGVVETGEMWDVTSIFRPSGQGHK